MPFYEYECPSCKYYVEVLQKINDKPLKKCPSCGKAGFKRLMSAPVFRLKGSGWYETDFKSDKDNQRNLAGADPEETKAAASKEEPKVEGKADAKDVAEGAKSASEVSKTDTAAPAAGVGKAEKPGKPATKRMAKSSRGATVKRAAKRTAKSASRRGRRR